MTLTQPRHSPAFLRRRFAPRLNLPDWLRREGITWQLGIGLAAVAIGLTIGRPSDLRLGLAAAAVAMALGLAARATTGLVYLVIVWTAVLGTVRRLLSGVAVANQADPLLGIAVAALLVLTISAAQHGAFRNRTRLASAVLVLNVITTLEALNPLQDSLKAGGLGLIFMLVPALAFWVGRGLCTDETISKVLRLLAGLSVLAAIYGLIQTFSGFPSWDERWIENSGYVALNVNKAIRAFGSFASGQEYALFLGVGVVVWLARGFRPGRVLWTVGACGLLMFALFYESSRSPLVTTIFAAGLMLAARRARNPLFVLVLGIGAVALIPIVITHLTSTNVSTTTGRLAEHQVSGLAHPFGSQSTLAGHFGLVLKGFKIMLHNPLGTGVSTVNIAGAKLGGVAANTEYDPSNVAIALGIPGLLVYIAVFFEAFRLMLRQARLRRDSLSLAALGIVAVTVLEWTNGGLYSVAFLPWLMLGWLDKADQTSKQERLVDDVSPPTERALAVSASAAGG